MGPKFGDAIKFCFRKRFDDSSPSLGSSADAVPALCDKLRDLMPKDGEPRGDVAEIYSHVVTRCTELAAGAVAERMLLPGEPVPSVSDVEQAVVLASLVCKSAEAVERFLGFAEQQAHDLLFPRAPVIIVFPVSRHLNHFSVGAFLTRLRLNVIDKRYCAVVGAL